MGDIRKVLATSRAREFHRAPLTDWGRDTSQLLVESAHTSPKALMLAGPEQIYEDRQKSVERTISAAELTDQMEHEETVRTRRNDFRHRKSERLNFSLDWEAQGQQKWKQNQLRFRRTEQRLLSYELSMIEKEKVIREKGRQKHKQEQMDGIDAFEVNRCKLGVGPDASVPAVLLPVKESLGAYTKKLEQRLGAQGFKSSANAELMEALSKKGAQGRKARHEREYRRRKMLTDQAKAQCETRKHRAEEERLQSLLCEGRQRRSQAKEFWSKRFQKRSPPSLADIGSSKAEDAPPDPLEAWSREVRSRWQDNVEQRRAKQEAKAREREMMRKAKRQRVQVTCQEVALKIVDLAVMASLRKADEPKGNLTLTQWRGLKAIFVSPEPLFVPPPPPSDSAHATVDSAARARATVSQAAFCSASGPWEPVSCCKSELGNLCASPVDGLLSTVKSLLQPDAGPLESPSSNTVLPIALSLQASSKAEDKEALGELALRLGAAAGLYVCSLEDAVEAALDYACEVKEEAAAESQERGDAEGEADAEIETPVLRREVFVEGASEESIAEFKEAALVFAALKEDPKKSAQADGLYCRTKLLALHLKCMAPSGRWALNGYPRTAIEAKVLEHVLVGYTDDEVHLEVTGKPAKKEKGKKRKSIAEEEELPLPHKSCLGLVLQLGRDEVVEDTILEEGEEGGAEVEEATAEPELDQLDQEKVEREMTEEERKRLELFAFWRQCQGSFLVEEMAECSGAEALIESTALIVNAAAEREALYVETVRAMAEAKELESEEKKEEGQEEVVAEAAASDGPEAEGEGEAEAEALDTEDAPPAWDYSLVPTLAARLAARREGMPVAVRIRQEVLCGERELDEGELRAVVAAWEKGGDRGYQESLQEVMPLLEQARGMSQLRRQAHEQGWESWTGQARGTEESWRKDSEGLSDALVQYLAHGGGNQLEDVREQRAVLERLDQVILDFELRAGDTAESRHANAAAMIDEVGLQLRRLAEEHLSQLGQHAAAAAQTEAGLLRDCAAITAGYGVLVGELPAVEADLTVALADISELFCSDVDQLLNSACPQLVTPLRSVVSSAYQQVQDASPTSSPEQLNTLRFACRLRGLLSGVTAAAERAEAILSSAEAQLKELNRRTTHCEHAAVAGSAKGISRMLWEGALGHLRGLLEEGGALVVPTEEDPSMSLEDPFRAADWGGNALTVDQVAALARHLISCFRDQSLVSLEEFTAAVLKWGMRENVPAVWSSDTYVQQLGRELGGNRVLWQQLIVSCLGHFLKAWPSEAQLQESLGGRLWFEGSPELLPGADVAAVASTLQLVFGEDRAGLLLALCRGRKESEGLVFSQGFYAACRVMGMSRSRQEDGDCVGVGSGVWLTKEELQRVAALGAGTEELDAGAAFAAAVTEGSSQVSLVALCQLPCFKHWLEGGAYCSISFATATATATANATADASV